MSIHYGTRRRCRHISGPGCIGPLLVTFLFAALANQAAAQIRPVDLGTLGGGNSSASAINDSGQVVGNSGAANAEQHAFSWTAAGGMVDLGTLGGVYSSATAVNGSGQVVGASLTANGETHAFSWTATGGMVDLGTLGGGFSEASAVNGSGQVVGDYSTSDSGRAFSWTAAGGMVDLGALGGDAIAVNDSGQVVGTSAAANDYVHAFSWTAAGGLIDLGTLGGGNSYATAVNGSGQVVGYSNTANGDLHAFSWTAAGGMIDLRTLEGVGGSYATGVNASGQVVGISTIEFQEHAFLWTATGGMIDLGAFNAHEPISSEGDVLGAELSARGQVVGNGRHSCYPCLSNAFSWTREGGMIGLGALDGHGPESGTDWLSVASAVNARGQVVGEALTRDGLTHAALWTVIAQTLPPVADAYIAAGASASRNFGSSRKLLAKLGVSADNTRRTYLKFDISKIGDKDRVTLRLHGAASSETGPVKSTLYAVSDTSWGEHTVTWNARPALGAVLGSVTVDGTAPQWVELDVTKFVRAERRAGRNVVSLALRNVTHTSANAQFDSREAGNTGPRLVITP